ncbi:unnamed protein product [Owenia fusiformis]|uniref:Uncharacterized protein n=1 Tax=Owenia fusiformis TaxID=6347 RepID=A0A8J1UG41_OWEFU|nr:unnamed protein product [Owenia fusiformis]
MARIEMKGIGVGVFVIVYISTTSAMYQNPLQILGKSTSDFAFDFYCHLTALDKTPNIFISPISISTVLSMTLLGARNNTANQMTNALHLQSLGGATHEAYRMLGASLEKSNKNITLKTANRMFGQEGFGFLPKYLKQSKFFYNASLQQLDFKHKPDASREFINKWVEKQTEDKIKNLLPEGSIVPFTKLVLTNAIYFQGNWMYRFNKTKTTNATFHLMGDPKAKVNATVMSMKTHLWFGMIPELDCKIVELPYSGNQTAMYVILPNEINGLKKVEMGLKNTTILEIAFKRMRNTTVDLRLPKYNMAAAYDLKPTLTSMGLRDLFTPAADLSGIDGRQDLWVSAFQHKAYVNVDEVGTTAAAATASSNRAIVPGNFFIDRPFLYFIREKNSGAVLFLGRIMCPMGYEKQCGMN